MGIITLLRTFFKKKICKVTYNKALRDLWRIFAFRGNKLLLHIIKLITPCKTSTDGGEDRDVEFHSRESTWVSASYHILYWMNTLSRKQAGRRLNQWTVRYHRRGRSNNVALPSASQETCGRLDVEGMDLQRNWLQLWWLTLNLIWVSPCVYVGGHTSPHCGRSASERSGADCYSRGSGEWLWCWLGCKSEGFTFHIWVVSLS